MFGLLKATSLGYERQKSKDVDRSSHSKVNAISKVVVKLCKIAMDILVVGISMDALCAIWVRFGFSRV